MIKIILLYVFFKKKNLIIHIMRDFMRWYKKSKVPQEKEPLILFVASD